MSPMNLVRDKMLRMFVAGTVFWMALVLTPRVWVQDVPTQASAEIPVRMLDKHDDCIWCEHYRNVEPAKCTDKKKADKPVWLNPDEPLEQQDSTPCLKKDGDDPSA